MKSKSLEHTVGMVKDCAADGRINAVSITDNPGGNPALLPEALGHTITEMDMDVIVHMACRDANRTGLESRAMQLMYLGIHNILALSGDYTDQGFSGLAAPVFDLDSVSLLCMLRKLNKKARSNDYPANLFTGCAVSPFKYSEEESFLQYRKLDHKIHAGASFIITQLGFDVHKFKECIEYCRGRDNCPPILGSLYFATPGAARVLSGNTVPGARIEPHIYEKVFSRVKTVEDSKELAAKLGAVIKGLGYGGIHIGGIHKKYSTVAAILDKMEVYSKDWEDIYKELGADGGNKYYLNQGNHPIPTYSRSAPVAAAFTIYDFLHSLIFSFNSFLAPLLKRMAKILDSSWLGRKFMFTVEEPAKNYYLIVMPAETVCWARLVIFARNLSAPSTCVTAHVAEVLTGIAKCIKTVIVYG
ncbi:MAG: methylenetetrahydrofolate reductase [Fibrobacteria bacterium]|nr:methylenetetrahydrofolate reductase [Fibrobacteria bacterium]